ncbi:hypothetical protein VFPPC_01256 [Pochonia chlamydosporia 170]|uniref:Uncharacterized protein n=1 Tax=Pochonia chlamydosporia 170 TaxID=1380566 RepID=A0A179G7T9_METCM|nr:hypothetical protein VFPPC_01256 [Pochonia chlamydosporia 170]OAQ73570.1 hypothetical protein VFPPC_01256 [Pochonia chlamydosporia 170]
MPRTLAQSVQPSSTICRGASNLSSHAASQPSQDCKYLHTSCSEAANRSQLRSHHGVHSIPDQLIQNLTANAPNQPIGHPTPCTSTGVSSLAFWTLSRVRAGPDRVFMDAKQTSVLPLMLYLGNVVDWCLVWHMEYSISWTIDC